MKISRQDVVRRCKLCGKLVHDGMMNEAGFYAHEDCFRVLMDRDYGPDGWMGYSEENSAGGYYSVKQGDEWVETGIFYTDFEDWDNVEYVIQYTDPITGAESPIDNFTAPEGYTAEEYLEDCRENATDEWNQMLQRGTIRLEEVEE